MADSKKYNGSTWEHSLRKLTTATDTLTILPVDVYADGNNATVGISGNTVQNGTPTPDNPIMPQGTGERTGNLVDKSILQNDKGLSSSGVVIDQSGRIATVVPVDVSNFSEVTLTYTATNVSFIYATFNSGTLVERVAGKESGYTISTSNCDALYVCFYRSSSITTDDVSKIMLNLGSTALPYEPYGYKIPISSASTTTPVYLGEVETTRRIKKLVFTGGVDEDWKEQYVGENRHLFRIYTNLGIIKTNEEKCTHFIYGATSSSTTTVTFDITSAGVLRFRPDNAVSVSLSDWTTWLQQQNTNGTPLTVWIVLATEETDIVNESLMRIGDYADMVSGITIPTITGADSFDVLTTLKPSEVELTYTGWHDANVQEWDGSQWNE